VKWGSGVKLHGSNRKSLMSALGQKRTSEHFRSMSALPPKADIGTQSWNVRFVPKADSCNAPKAAYRVPQNFIFSVTPSSKR